MFTQCYYGALEMLIYFSTVYPSHCVSAGGATKYIFIATVPWVEMLTLAILLWHIINVPCFPTLCYSAIPMSSQLLYLRNAQDSCLKHEITCVHTLHTGSRTSLELHIIAVVCRFITEHDPWCRAGKHCLCSEEVALTTKLVVCCWVVCVMFQLPYLPCIHLSYMEL